MSGKGSSPRPYSVTNEEYANRWDAIFGRDQKTPEVTPEVTPEEPPKWAQLELPLDTPEGPLSQPVASPC